MRPEGAVLLEQQIDAADPDELGILYETVAALKARCQARLLRHAFRSVPKDSSAFELWLTPQQAANMLGQSKRWVYSHWQSIPGARKESPRQLRIPESGIQRLKAVR